MPSVWVYVMLFGIHIGQQMSSLSQDGLLPFSIRLSVFCALIEFARVAVALLMILFIRQVPLQFRTPEILVFASFPSFAATLD